VRKERAREAVLNKQAYKNVEKPLFNTLPKFFRVNPLAKDILQKLAILKK